MTLHFERFLRGERPPCYADSPIKDTVKSVKGLTLAAHFRLSSEMNSRRTLYSATSSSVSKLSSTLGEQGMSLPPDERRQMVNFVDNHQGLRFTLRVICRRCKPETPSDQKLTRLARQIQCAERIDKHSIHAVSVPEAG